MIRRFIRKYYIEILSFIIPIIIFLLACAFSKIFPFGDKYIVAYDASAQYPGFSNILMNVLKGKQSLFYTFKGGLGYNFYATAIYYLFNPTSLLSIFFNSSNTFIFYELIVLLRLGLCGLTMSIYLRGKEKLSRGRLLFSLAYALMAYNVVYFYNFMYFDTVVFLPLVILGLDKIIEGKSSKTYIIFLTLSIISNYYIGSMTCIFCLLYFIYKYVVIDKKKRKGLIKKFIISSLLSGLMCTFVLLPEFFELMRGKVSLYTQEYTVYNKWSLDFLSSFYRLSIASYSSGDQIDGAPNIYCSLLVLVYTVLFFFNKKYTLKERIATLVFMCFFLLCFSFNFLDYAWQFFQRPCWYPNRYSFVFSFLLIITAYKAYNNVDDININKNLLYVVIGLLILTIIGAAIYQKLYSKDFSKWLFLILSVICIIEYAFSYKIKILPFLITTIFIFEITANTFLSVREIGFSKQRGKYDETYTEMKSAFDYIKEIDPVKNNFYRVDSQSWVNINNPGTFDYNGLLVFDSLRNGPLMHFLEYYAKYTVVDECSTRFNALNPVFTSMLGFKYTVTGSVENYYERIRDDKYRVFKNDDYLSLGFMVNNEFKNIDLNEKLTYENTNEIVNKSLNKNLNILKKDTYKYLTYKEDEDYIYYKSDEGGYVAFEDIADKDYFIFPNPNHDSATSNFMYINDESDIYYNNFSPYLINKGDKYQMRFVTNVERTSKNKLFVYLMDVDAYKKWIEEMKKNQLEIITYEKDDYIKGKINVTKDKTTLFTSIPYDDGWRVFVDGKKVKYDKLLTAFIGLDLTEGEHIIEFKYIPKGLILGTIVSLISLIGSIIYIKKEKVTK